MISPRTTARLGALALALAGWLLLAPAPPAPASLATTRPLLGGAAIREIELRRDAWTAIRLERGGDDGLLLVEPEERRVDAARARELISILGQLAPIERLPDEAEDAARRHALGIDPPRLLAVVRDDTGTERRLAIGVDSSVDGAGTYARQDHEPDVLVLPTREVSRIEALFTEILEAPIVAEAPEEPPAAATRPPPIVAFPGGPQGLQRPLPAVDVR